MTNRYLVAQESINFQVETWPAVSPNAHFIDAVSESISGDRGFLNPETSAHRLKRNKIGGGISYGGEVQVPMYPVQSTSLLYYLLGICNTTVDSPSTGLNTHELTMALVPPNFILGVGKDLMEHRFGAAVMKGCTIDYEANEVLLGTFDILVRNELLSGPLASVTFPDYNISERAFAGTEVLQFVDDVEVDYIENMSIEMTNNIVDDNYVLGSRLLPNKYVQGFEVTGTIEMAYSDYQRYQDFLDEESLKVELKGSYNGPAVDATYRAIETGLPKIQLNTADLPTESSDRYLLEIEYMGERDNTDNAIYINVINELDNAEMVA